MKKLRWQLIIIFLTGLVVGILLLGEQPLITPMFRPQPVQGGVYTEALIGSMQRLDPVMDFYNRVDRDVDRLIFSQLIRFDERGLPQPDLAESWGISKDGTIYNFTIRSNVRWHDGEPLTSGDVIFTIGLLQEGGETIPGDLQAFWGEIEVKFLDETNLQFHLPYAFAPFLDYLTFGVLPKHLLGNLSFEQLADSPYNLQPVGSGPFKFSHLITEEDLITGVVLSAFEAYYGKEPFIEQITFVYYPDHNAALQAYRDNEVQGISEVAVGILPDVLGEEDLALYTGRMPEISMVLLNLQNPEVPFFLETSVRKALLYGINRQWMIDRLLMGQAVMTDSPILPGTWAYYDGLVRIDYDPDRARNLLRESGYVVPADGELVREKEETQVRFTLLYPDDDAHEQLVEVIQSNWLALDIAVEIEPVPYDQLINERLEQRDYQAALVDLNLARTPDPDPYPFWNQLQAIGGQNYSQWDHRMASEYLEQARVENDLVERKRLYHNFQVIFNQEMPALPLFYPVYTYAVDRQVLGVKMGPLFESSDRFAMILEWYMEARLPTAQSSPPGE